MSHFKTAPMCEECKTHEATSFTCILGESPPEKNHWRFTCDCTSERDDYYIQFDRFFANPPAVVDWMAHMHEKLWMDWSDFMEMMTRFRAATDSFGAE